MKITCDNCGAVYRIPEEKLTKEVSRATCKKCGAKLIIRRPTEDSDSLRLGGAQGSLGDDDSVINHEERTVIAQVPELQKFDATPPLGGSGSVGSQEELRGLLGGNAPAEAQAPTRTQAREPVAPAATPVPQPPSSVPEMPSSPPPAAQRETVRVPPVSAPPAPMAQQAAPHQPAITATTSPARPSGEPSPVAPQAAPQPSPRPQAPAKKANVVDIFSQQPKPAAGVAPELQKPVSKLPLGLLVIALLSILAFIPDGLWGLTKTTAIGFFLTLYCILAAGLTQWDLTSSGKINYIKVFLIPAVICGVLLTLLISVQPKIAFMYPNVDVELVKEYIKSLPDAPKAEKDMDLTVALKKAEETGRIARRRTRNSRKPTFTKPDRTAGVVDTSLKDGADGDLALNDSSIGTIDTGWTPKRQPRRLPTLQVAKADSEVQFDAEGINKAMEEGRVKLCILTAAGGVDLPGRIDLQILMRSDGSAQRARIITKGLEGGSLERCMSEKIATVRFPTFKSSKPQWYTYPFIL